MASLRENAASDKIQVSSEIKNIKFNLGSVKTELSAAIDRIAVSHLDKCHYDNFFKSNQ